MPYNTPAQTAQLAVDSGAAKAALPVSRQLVGGFLAGAYIAFGALLAIVGTAGLKANGTTTLLTGLTFSLGLILVVIGGAELLTGNMALIPMAVLAGRATVLQLVRNWVVLIIGNLAGALFVAYVISLKTGVVGYAGASADTGPGMNVLRLGVLVKGKAVTESDLEVFLRAIGCNWLVCLAVILAIAATDVGGKILAIVFPITAFVALGFDHVVANMFFLPLALWAHVPGVTAAHLFSNLLFAFLGNAVGAGVFVGFGYYFLYVRNAVPAKAAVEDSAPGAARA